MRHCTSVFFKKSKDLMKEVMNLIEEYYVSYDKSVKPAKPKDE